VEVQQQYGDQVQFLGVPGLADQASIERFVAETGVGAFPHITDETSGLWERFGVTDHRAYIYIDDDGTSTVGGYGNLEADVQALIAS
jgi:hypothetical protein